MKTATSAPVMVTCPRCKADVGEVKVWLDVDYKLTNDGKKDVGKVDIDVKVAEASASTMGFHTSSETIEHVCSDLELIGNMQAAQRDARRVTALDMR